MAPVILLLDRQLASADALSTQSPNDERFRTLVLPAAAKALTTFRDPPLPQAVDDSSRYATDSNEQPWSTILGPVADNGEQQRTLEQGGPVSMCD